MTKSDLTYMTEDTNGDVAPVHMLGRVFEHLGNGHHYRVTDVTWMGGTDEWGLIHQRTDMPIICTRTLNNFKGNRSNGEKRFRMLDILWQRYRFRIPGGDGRPMAFPSSGPYWTSGTGGDAVTMVAFVPSITVLQHPSHWPDAFDIDHTHNDTELFFTDRFDTPKWWKELQDGT